MTNIFSISNIDSKNKDNNNQNFYTNSQKTSISEDEVVYKKDDIVVMKGHKNK